MRSDTPSHPNDPPQPPDRLAEQVDVEQSPRLRFPVVGVGASAGGLEAFSDFFSVMPPDSGMAFVLILHLPPERDSMLVDILSKRTDMAVAQVEEGLAVEANHVYVIRPGRTITIRDGALHLEEPLEAPGHRHPVDDFFQSLAEEQRERAICIVMSGMGSNGSAGARSVKAVGGVCIAQDPESAKFPTMPRNLINSGMADFILRPQDIPEVLIRYATHPYAKGTRASTLAQRERQSISDILTIMRARTNQDFGAYKKPTLVRRIQRRMGLNQITKMGDYARLLQQTPVEVSALADDLMIHVTGFFRDTEAWEALRTRVIAPLIAEREADGSIRAWVTACSSGEEAYTLAMLLVEEVEAAGKRLNIKIFATDTAERSLSQARSGIFPAGIEREVTVPRLERFFDRDDSSYRIKKNLREMVVFAPQNVLQDPPFSQLDICTCRNLLIYLEPQVQQRLLHLLHFGLRDGGALFLGTSETTSSAEDLFEPIDKKHRVFRRIGPTRHGAIDFPFPRALSTRSDAERADARPMARTSIAQITTRALLDRYTPPAIVVDRQQRIVYFHGHTERYLDQPQGEPTRELMMLVHESVRGAVRTALQKAFSQNGPVTVRDGTIDAPQGRRRVAVTAAPLEPKAGSAYFLISFDEFPELPPAPPPPAGQTPDNRPELEDELRGVRDELQSTIEELQTSNEEMKASNEEVTSVNEELQSTNEELQTSKEELQSLNEELITVNTQLQAKMHELQGMTNDLSSLLSSTDIGVVFLDTQFRIRRFTPAMKDLIDLIPPDVGRPLSDLARKFTDAELLPDVQSVLERLIPLEREVTSETGRIYMRRALPYRTTDNRIDGVVVTFVDVTRRQRAEEELRRGEERYRLIVESIKEYAIFTLDLEGRIETWTPSAQQMLGFSAAEVIGQPWSLTFIPEDRKHGEPDKRLQLARERGSASEERWCLHKDGSVFWISGVLSILTDAEKNVRGFVKVVRDNTDRRQFEERLKESKRAAEIASDAKDQFLANVSHELRTPLSAMLLWANLLKDAEAVGADKLREGIDAIKRSAEAQKELIEDLLDTSRIAAGKLRLDLKQTELVSVVQAAVEAVRPAALAKELALTEEADAAVGTVRADPHRIQQVVWNLLSNAVKFTPAGGRINVATRRQGDDVEIIIADTGQGISEEFMSHLFERFGQGELSTTRAKSGLGLGLSIARQLVELHGGTISAQSAGKGHGATFTVRLPLPTIAVDANGDAPGHSTHVQIAGSLKGCHILLVEDEVATRDALVAILRQAEAEVSAADSAVSALDAYQRSRPALIISDIGLPDRDGYNLVQSIRKLEDAQHEDHVPAIALSAYTGEKNRRKALASGFQLHLSKPIEPLKLISEILALKLNIGPL
jgi:two-component system CheB/CheR fusion protein